MTELWQEKTIKIINAFEDSVEKTESEMWSFGVLLYVLLTKTLPFENDDRLKN